MVMPQLSECIGEELLREASISKGKVKAYQLRKEIQNLSGFKGKPSAKDVPDGN